jgi:MFS family permease
MPLPSLRRLPGDRPFHLLLVGLAVSACGDWLYNVALLAFVYARTGSPTWLAATTAARVLPMIVVGPLGGVLADRYDRRALMLAADLVRALLMVALAAVAAFGLPVALAPVLAALAVTASTVHPPALAASTARLVPGDDLPRANALRSAIGQGAIVVGPALGALVLAATSPAVAILANALTFLLSAVAIACVPAGPVFAPARSGATRPTVLADVRAGARALRGAPVVVRLIAADVLCSVVYGFLTVALVLVGRRLGAGEGGFGLLLGGYGAGGIAGAFVAGRFSAAWRRTLGVALTLVAVPLFALGGAPSLAAALALAVVAGSGMVVAEVLAETALPTVLDDAVLARAYGFVLPAAVTGIAAGSLAAGPLIALLGLSGALAAMGATVLAAAALLVRRPLAVAPAPVPAPAA